MKTAALLIIGDEVYWGYFAVMALMATACGGLFVFFRKHGWL